MIDPFQQLVSPNDLPLSIYVDQSIAFIEEGKNKVAL